MKKDQRSNIIKRVPVAGSGADGEAGAGLRLQVGQGEGGTRGGSVGEHDEGSECEVDEESTVTET